MGAACCVAARDRTINHGSSRDIVSRNVHHSPSWSFRWDNRGRVAGEETSASWLSDGISRSEALDSKSVTDISAHSSVTGRSLENDRTGAWCKSAMEERTALNLRTSASGQSISTNISLEVEPAESSQASDPRFGKVSPSMYSTASTPSLSMGPLSFQSPPLPPASTPSGWTSRSPGQNLSWQVSDSQSSGRNSPSINESTRESHGRSSDAWSIHAFSEIMSSASRRERWSFDSGTFNFNNDKISRTGRNSASPTPDSQNCGICSKLLTQKSAWSGQKIIANNELSVAAVLMCGHVYHAECLENITSDTNKYDPACPVCTFGEKRTLKLTSKLLKAEKELKLKSIRRSRSRVADTDGSMDFDYWRGSEIEGKGGAKLTSSSSLKSSTGKPFLKRHFSFRSKGSKSSHPEESHSIRSKGLFWPRFSRG
ncbi:hypothetical protein V2J09_018710 [Rumex salicifolius]